MVCRVLAGSCQRVDLVQPAQRTEPTVQQVLGQGVWQSFEIDGQQVEEIVKAAFLDLQLPVHEGFADAKPRPCGEFSIEGRVMQPNGDARSRYALKGMNAA